MSTLSRKRIKYKLYTFCHKRLEKASILVYASHYMLFEPQISALKRHIDNYWIVDDITQLTFGNDQLYAYPGITPDMLIV